MLNVILKGQSIDFYYPFNLFLSKHPHFRGFRRAALMSFKGRGLPKGFISEYELLIKIKKYHKWLHHLRPYTGVQSINNVYANVNKVENVLVNTHIFDLFNNGVYVVYAFYSSSLTAPQSSVKHEFCTKTPASTVLFLKKMFYLE